MFNSLIKESPRWLYARENQKKSFDLLKAIAKSNKRSFPDNINVIKVA